VPRRLLSARPRLAFAGLTLALLAAVGTATILVAQSRRDFEVVARKYSFRVVGSDVPEIHVTQNDLVHITFSSEDIPHSFTIEEAPYRIMRRAEPGKPVSFDFRADHAGRFRFFCNLKIDERCKEMLGTLVVDPAR
jgi:heme/copper-type cytochrome/quinol oxidase subunit 2